jgi:hypothetical protein
VPVKSVGFNAVIVAPFLTVSNSLVVERAKHKTQYIRHVQGQRTFENLNFPAT